MSALGRLLFGKQERRDLFSLSSLVPSPTQGYWNNTGTVVTGDSALRNAAVYSCVNLIANSLATTPLDVYRKRANGVRETIDPAPKLLTKPDPNLTLVEWLFQFFTSALLRGNTYGYLDDFDALGYPQTLVLVHPDEVTVERRDGEITYRFGRDVIPKRNVFHMRAFTMPGWLEGLSPVRYFAQAIGMGLAAEDFGARWFGNDANPSGVLETTQVLTDAQAEAIMARFLARVSGRKPVALGAGMTWKPISVPANESQFLETMRFTVNQIARIFNVPAEKIGGAADGSSITYGNREANVIEFQTDALLPWAVRFEQAMFPLLPGKQFVKFNMDAAIRVDITTRYAAYRTALGDNTPILIQDEVRQLEDRAPLPKPKPPEQLQPFTAPPSEEEDETDEQ